MYGIEAYRRDADRAAMNQPERFAPDAVNKDRIERLVYDGGLDNKALLALTVYRLEHGPLLGLNDQYLTNALRRAM